MLKVVPTSKSSNDRGPSMRQIADDLNQRADTRRTGPERLDFPLKSCEAKLLAYIRGDWAVDYGTREVRLVIEYQDKTPVLIRVTRNAVTEEKLR